MSTDYEAIGAMHINILIGLKSTPQQANRLPIKDTAQPSSAGKVVAGVHGQGDGVSVERAVKRLRGVPE